MIDELSCITTPILLNDPQQHQGTGFFYTHKDMVKKLAYTFLITNNHVITGFESPRQSSVPLGDTITFYIRPFRNSINNVLLHRLPLITAVHGKIWFSSKDYPDADIAIIPITISHLDSIPLSFIDTVSNNALKVPVMSSVTIIGYPYLFHDKKNALPIYKSGNIASEPEVDFNGEPYFITDISVFPGMSGSPVFSIASNTFNTTWGIEISTVRAIRFLGIFSAIVEIKTDRIISLELAKVWKADIITKMIKDYLINH